MPEPPARRSPLRWIAPLALIACVVAAYAIATSSSGGNASKTDRPAASSSSSKGTTQAKSASTSTGGRRRYTIRSGDTLTSIAARTGVSVERIQELNPKLDPQALQAGKTIKLRP